MSMPRWLSCLTLLLFYNTATAVDSYQWGNITLRTGQIVVADGLGPTSILLSLVAVEYSPFTHSGLVIIEEHRPYIYESRGKYPFWNTESPGEGTRGFVSRTPFYEFLKRQPHVEFYEPPAQVNRKTVVAFARKAYLDKIPFDARFSPGRDSYYCSEFVAYALEAGGLPVKTTRFKDNPSLLVLRRWWGATNPSIVTVASLIEKASYAGALTVYASRSNFYAYVAAKRELHRRFTPEQRLGNVFYLENKKLKIRPAIRRFILRAMDLFPDEEVPFSTDKIDQRIHEFAEVYFEPAANQ